MNVRGRWRQLESAQTTQRLRPRRIPEALGKEWRNECTFQSRRVEVEMTFYCGLRGHVTRNFQNTQIRSCLRDLIYTVPQLIVQLQELW